MEAESSVTGASRVNELPSNETQYKVPAELRGLGRDQGSVANLHVPRGNIAVETAGARSTAHMPTVRDM